MMWKYLVLGAFLANYVLGDKSEESEYGSLKSHDIQFAAMEQCSAGGHPIDLSKISSTSEVHEPSLNTIIFNELEIACDGNVGSWVFFAETTGSFYACIFRPNRTANTISMQGCNMISVVTLGSQVFEVPEIKRISVRSGDMVAVGKVQGENSFVVSLRQVMKPSAGVRQSETIQLSDVMDVDAKLGSERHSMGILKGVKYSVSISAHVEGTPSTLQLAHGNKKREGVAQLFMQGVWGYICDLWYHAKGWPNLFCKTLGFPESEDAYFVTNEHKELMTEGAPLFLHNLRCKPSQGHSVFSCSLHSRGNCTLDNAVFIKCKPRVQLTRNENDRCTGIPETWVNGYWGTVCDEHEPSLHETNSNHSWTSALCTELDCGTKASKVDWATTNITNYSTNTKPNYFNPSCNVFPPTVMRECPSQNTKTCNNTQDYYIKCGD